MAKDVLKIEGGEISKSVFSSYKTEGEFLGAIEKDKSYNWLFEGEPNRADKLKELYRLTQPKKEEPK